MNIPPSFLTQFIVQNDSLGDVPGGPAVKNLPCNAGDTRSIPDLGTRIPHATEQLSGIQGFIRAGPIIVADLTLQTLNLILPGPRPSS